ncbi:MAG: hypothetical protein KBD63_07515, partial [Bacteriovoracaceae bacterium]|nr:hypothetical protein [Bacteriovoracaceae bacterium]
MLIKEKFNPEKLELWKKLVQTHFDNPPAVCPADLSQAFRGIVDGLDMGEVRIAEKKDSQWLVNDWAKKAILLWFRYTPSEKMYEAGLPFLDKVPVKEPNDKIRIVPPGVARYGSYMAGGSILMPGYINIGAYVD